jgi:hypothetical protein
MRPVAGESASPLLTAVDKPTTRLRTIAWYIPAYPAFGCAPERDWTYFGDAFFRQSLHPGADFENAFDHARVLIHRWEMMDGAVPSNPQARFGRGLVGRLARFFATNPGQ